MSRFSWRRNGPLIAACLFLVVVLTVVSWPVIGLVGAALLSTPRTALLRQVAVDSWIDGATKCAPNADLTRRLNAMFPAGTTETVLRKSLVRQGFKLVAAPPEPIVRSNCPTPAVARDRGAHREWFSGACGIQASVGWRTDAASKVVVLAGYAYQDACL